MRLGIAYIFEDSDSRTKGLQGHRIRKDECALFVYEGMSIHKFWMKGVHTHLYLSSVVDGRCAESQFMNCDSTDVHSLMTPSALVIESRVEIPVGSSVNIIGDALVVS